MSKIKKFSANTVGIDYICADIHGHFSLLENRMREVNFDTRKDRLFSLGDIIDRGDESEKALQYLQYPWFHAILGNHELMLMKAYKSDDSQIYDWWYYWGGDWAQSLSKAQLTPYFDSFKRLPVAIELSLRDHSKVGLVHAQLPSPVSWNTVCDQLSRIPRESSDPENYLFEIQGFEKQDFDKQDFDKQEFDKQGAAIAGATRKDITEMLWAKTQVYGTDKEKAKLQPVRDIDHVFHGHSIIYYRPETITNRTFMDLGSYETGEIGFIDPVVFLQNIA